MPVDPRFRDWLTIGFERTLLVVARTETALSRLLDVVSLLERDRRIQIVFTTDADNPAMFRVGLDEHLTARGARTIPWAQATGTRFDLAVSASENDNLAELDAPTLLVSHGFGHQKYYPNSDVVAGLNPARLIRDGAVIPTVIALAHADQLAYLARNCPPADRSAVVIGDPTLDRLLASRFRADGYRAALDATGKTLVAVSSTWGTHSLLGRHPHLPELLAEALEVDEVRLVLLLHSGVRSAHGPWQIRAWLSRAAELGVHVLTPTDNWQAVLAAADCLITDQNSLALYAAANDRPILLVEGTGAKTVTGSPLAELAELAPRLRLGEDLAAQVNAAIADYRSGRWASVLARAVQWRGGSAEVLRGLLYRLLHLPEPLDEAAFRPVDVPAFAPRRVAALIVGATEDGHIIALRRYPLADRRPLAYQHIVADLDSAGYRELGAASVLVVTGPRSQFGTRSTALLAQWPRAELIAMAVDETTVWLTTRQGVLSARAADPPPGFDPVLMASLVYVRREQGSVPAGTDKLRVGEAVTEVLLAAAD